MSPVLQALPTAVAESDVAYATRTDAPRYLGFAHPMRLAHETHQSLGRAYELLHALASAGLAWEVRLDRGLPWYSLSDLGMDTLLAHHFGDRS